MCCRYIIVVSDCFFEISGTMDNSINKNLTQKKDSFMNATIPVTEVRVFPVKNSQSKIRAFAQLVIGNSFKITGLRIIEGDNGLFVGYPSEKGQDGKYHEFIKPINRSGVDLIQDSVLKEYEHSLVAA